MLIRLDRNGGGPLGAQLERELRQAIRSQRLTAGERLPSSRKLAAELGVSRGLVQECYAQLLAEGFLIARGGSGTRGAAGAERPTASPQQPSAARRARPAIFAPAGRTSQASRAKTGYGRCARPHTAPRTKHLATAIHVAPRSYAK